METQEALYDIVTLINQFIASADDEEISKRYSSELSQLIIKDEMTLLQFIQKLGPTLTSDDDLIRAKSVNCLVTTLDDLKGQKLSKQDVNVLLDFLLAKLEDKYCLKYILAGLNTLVNFKTFFPNLNDNLTKLLESILNKYDPKKHLAKVRYEPFQILASLLDNHFIYIQANESCSNLFIKTFIYIASGEKDPKNLLLSFGLNTRINETFAMNLEDDLHKEFLNDLFDICFCYFPISFTPPPNDPYNIAADDLKLSLRTTIASQSLFAKDSFSSLIEKFTSTNPMVRNDVLKTMLFCIRRYKLETILEYWVTIWNALKFEILHNEVSLFKPHLDTIIPSDYDGSIEDTDDNKPLILTLVILKELGSRILESDQFENFLMTITNELKGNLVSVNDKTFKQSVLVLSVLASDSTTGFNFILKFLFSYEIWGKFINVENEEEAEIEELPEVDKSEDLVLNIAKQRDLIDNLGFIFTSYKVLVSNIKDKDFLIKNNLKEYKDYLLIFMGQLLQTSSNLEKTLKCKVVQQLIKLIQLTGFLNIQECSLIFGYFNDILVNTINEESKNWEKDLVIKEIINGLIKIMDDNETIENITTSETRINDKVSLVVELILPTFLNLFVIDQNDKFDLIDFKKLLDIITDLCVNYQFLEVLSIRLLNKLAYFNHSSLLDEEKVEVFGGITNLFINSIYKTESSKQFLMNSWYKNFIPRFLNCLIGLLNLISESIITELGGDLIGLIIKFIDKSKHQEILNDFIKLFLLNEDILINTKISSFIEKPNSLIGIFNKVLSNIDKSTKFEIIELKDVIEKVVQIIYSAHDNDFLRLSYLQNLAILINKFVNSEEDLRIIKTKLDKIYDEISNINDELTEKEVMKFEVLIWITKSLVLKTNKIGITYINGLMDLLNNKNIQIKTMTSRSLNILFIDLTIFSNQTPKVKKIISKVSNLNVKPLFKQQIFEIILPKLIGEYISTKDEIYLISLSLILNNVSSQILKPHLSQILPLILNSLLIKNSMILKASLSTLNIIINENSELIIPYLSSIIPKLIELSVKKIIINKKYINNEEIRLLSLNCLLNIFGRIEYKHLIYYQNSTLAELVTGLDDKKRNVRKLCCDVRQVLFELGK